MKLKVGSKVRLKKGTMGAIYLYKEGSNIAYEMSLGNYNGPDKDEYSLEDIINNSSKVISIIWK